jgi:hypothetical protein
LSNIVRTPSDRSTPIYSSKADLFSDDLFDDDTDEPAAGTEENPLRASTGPEKKKYLDEKWKLNPEDEKDFEGFPSGNNEKNEIPAGAQLPVFALMYKFRKEYLDNALDSSMADHKGHCDKYKRLLNSELINLGKAKGVVLLWTGLSEDDKATTKADIMDFLEEDPLISKDMVERWDLIDLQKKGAMDALPSAPAAETAAPAAPASE